MSTDAAPATERRFRAGGCLLRVGIAAAILTGIVVAIGTIFNEGDNADQPVHGFIAGKVDALPPGSVNYFEQQHLFLTNVPGVGFVALYDRSSRQQELNGDCRVHYEDTAGIGTLAPLPGTTGALVEDCNNARAVWRVDGMFAFGNSYGDLDHFDVQADAQGEVIVDTESRSCTRSRGVIGIAPFDVRRCGTGD
jgi:hypothetical protein